MEEDGFGANPYFQCLVAEDTDTPDVLIGYCLFFYTYSTWEGRSLYMEDLYVTPKYRGKGTGQGMWKSAVKVSRKTKAT